MTKIVSSAASGGRCPPRLCPGRGAVMLFFVRAERREDEEGGGREPLEGKRRVGVFFFSPFLWLSTVFLFFGVEMQVKKPCQLVSTCFFIFLQIKKSLPSSNLAAKFQTWQPSSNLAVATGGTSGKYTKPKKLGRKLSTWHKYCQVRTWQPSSNLALGTNLARTWQ